MFSAYPRRSIEGTFTELTRTGDLWPFVLSAVALLGTEYPAINTLEDIQALWGSEVPKLYPVEDAPEMMASGNMIRARRLTDVKWKRESRQAQARGATPGATTVAAQATVDDIRQAYYETLGPAEAWWWIRAVLINPLQIVVDDDMGSLWLVDVMTDADDNITFGEPQEVKVQYVAAAGLPNIRQPGQIIAATHETPADTGREARPDETAPAPQVQDSTTQQEERTMLTEDALRRLGLEPGASDAEISAAILAAAEGEQPGGGGEGEQPGQGEQPGEGDTPPGEGEQPGGGEATPGEQPGETATLTIPEGMQLIDSTVLTELQQGVAASNAEIAKQRIKERDEFIAGACRAGKFARSRIAHFTSLWETDPDGTRELINKLAPGLVPVAERGSSDPAEVAATAAAAAYPEHWKPAVAASRRNSTSRVKVVND
jgi:hypothetical protein